MHMMLNRWFDSVLCWCVFLLLICFFFFKQKTAYEMRISDWSSDVCSSDLVPTALHVSPEALSGGAIGKVREGDMIRLDADAGVLEALVDAAQWNEIGRASCRERVCQYV